jgi:hypothetical protein
MSDENQDRHAVLSEAFDRLAAEPDPEPVVEPAEVAAPAEIDVEPDTRTAAERARDDKGRFAPKGDTKLPETSAAAPERAQKVDAGKTTAANQGKPAGAESPPSPAGQPAPETPAVKPPQSWKPAAREAFSKAPPEVQQEVMRREHEITRTLQENAEARKFAETVQRQLSPFEGLARANGMDAMSYAGSVMQAAAQLFQGPRPARHAVVASLIQQAGLTSDEDLTAISQALAGKGAAPSQPQTQPAFDPRAEVHRVLQEERQREDAERSRQVVQDFIATQPEFLNDVYEDMAAIIESDKRAGRNPDVKRAYDRACKLNEDVSKILEQRKAVETARTAQAATQRTRAAASSIRSQPAVAASAQPADRREVIARRYDELST